MKKLIVTENWSEFEAYEVTTLFGFELKRNLVEDVKIKTKEMADMCLSMGVEAYKNHIKYFDEKVGQHVKDTLNTTLDSLFPAKHHTGVEDVNEKAIYRKLITTTTPIVPNLKVDSITIVYERSEVYFRISMNIGFLTVYVTFCMKFTLSIDKFTFKEPTLDAIGYYGHTYNESDFIQETITDTIRWLENRSNDFVSYILHYSNDVIAHNKARQDMAITKKLTDWNGK